MYLFIEVWNVKPAWLALSQAERADYMQNVGPAIQEMLESGIEIVGWGFNEEETPVRADYKYFAVWKMADKSLVGKFEQVVEQAGWYNYFEQHNLRGELVSPDPVIAEHISL